MDENSSAHVHDANLRGLDIAGARTFCQKQGIPANHGILEVYVLQQEHTLVLHWLLNSDLPG